MCDKKCIEWGCKHVWIAFYMGSNGVFFAFGITYKWLLEELQLSRCHTFSVAHHWHLHSHHLQGSTSNLEKWRPCESEIYMKPHKHWAKINKPKNFYCIKKHNYSLIQETAWIWIANFTISTSYGVELFPNSAVKISRSWVCPIRGQLLVRRLNMAPTFNRLIYAASETQKWCYGNITYVLKILQTSF